METRQDISRISSDECTGCAACYSICPQKAITMQPDEEGFLFPVVDIKNCTSCGLCLKTCPALHTSFKNSQSPECYAVMANDEIRMASSSGGMFTLLANYIFEKNGYVCGAAFDENWNVKHCIINNRNDLQKLRGSKYVQSEIGDCYKDIKTLLEQENFVLFSGCPCQVAGLYAFLGKEYEKLYTVDLICHGVPSPKVWQKYLHEEHDIEKTREISFRDKKYGWSVNVLSTLFNGDIKSKNWNNDIFLATFSSMISVRAVCTSCKFAVIPRQGDITIGDFWGISAYSVELNDKKGVSVALLNNNKGNDCFELVKYSAHITAPVPLEIACRGNWNLKNPSIKHHKRQQFFNDINSMPVRTALKKNTQFKYDVGIFSWFYGHNYGSMLTAYAMQELIKSLGYSYITINYHAKKFYESHKDITINVEFQKYFSINNKDYITKNQLKELNNIVDCFVIGSDQLWNYQLADTWSNGIYYGNFIRPEKKIVSFSTSFGRDKEEYVKQSDEDHYLKKKYLLGRLDAISVREKEAVELCEELFHIRAEQVIDPVFCVPVSVYDILIKKSSVNFDKKFLAYYIFDQSNSKNDFIEFVAKKMQLDIIDISRSFSVSVEDWLSYVKNCELLITDSFHGVAFAIIFKKQFINVSAKTRGYSRFNTIFSLFNITNKSLPYYDKNLHYDNLFVPIDYKKVDELLVREKERSISWLKNALEAPKKQVLEQQAVFEIITSELEDQIEKNSIALADLQVEKLSLQNNIRDLSDRLVAVENNFTAVLNSVSFNLGRVLTFLPRKVRTFLRCLRYRGLRFTLKLIAEKIRRA